jgi:hypothetical protein
MKRLNEKREQINEYNRRYRQTGNGHRKRLESARKRQPFYRDKYRERYREKNRAREAVRDKFPSASTKMCLHCGKQAKDWHHHRGYDRAHRFDVIPLCKKCHAIADKLQREAKKEAAVAS